ncbi:MAG TPA: M28 family peptidase, partial [Thermoanaerobaculia bacterium]|nr:M28 family peptidase [Thermoanaerobaculia bacterium]
ALALSTAAAALAAAPAPQAPPPAALPAELRETAAALQAAALQGTGAYEIVRSLTTEVGPRLAGSPGDKAAVEWGLRTLRALGFANVRAEPVEVPHWDRGTIEGRITAPFAQPVVLTALGGSVATPEAGIEAEVVEAGSLEALDALGERARGKIVFLSPRMPRRRDGAGYGRTVGIRGAGPSRAAKLGAVALLIRSVGTSDDRLPHTGSLRYEEGVPRIPAAALSNPDADLLRAQLASGRPVTFRLALRSRELPPEPSANVVGEVRGRERPEEVVLLACHLDSWDLGTGALDDAAGCGIVIEAARRIGALPRPPRRTVRVVLYANEEFGLSGARAYAAAHADELPRHVLAGESDFGDGRVYELSTRVAAESLPAVEEIAALLEPLGVSRGGNEAGGGADLIPLRPARVPVVALAQDGTFYFDRHHSPNDTLDKVSARDLDQNVAAWVAVAYAAAEMETRLGQPPADPPPP